MNYLELQQAKETFRYISIEKERQVYYQARKAFVEHFTIKRIAKMSIDDYVIGNKNYASFCYRIERELAPLGNITGQWSSKFGVWRSSETGEYKTEDRLGKDYNGVFVIVKNQIIDLIEAGENDDVASIINNRLNSLFKGKILATYFPEKFLNIFSNGHLNHYLISLNLDTRELIKSDPVLKRQALVDFKNKDEDMKHWSIDMFALFLWSHYPGDPKRSEEVAAKLKLKQPVFPAIRKIEFVDLELDSSPSRPHRKPKTNSGKSPNYEAEAARARQLGDRGEHIIMEAEIERLMKERGISKKKASKLVKHVSQDSDSYGYDIQSVNSDNSHRYIEVKATQGKVGDMTFFYTSHELETAKMYGDAYYLYIVYEISSSKPKIAIFQNPFLNEGLDLVPIKYRVNLKTK